jgi:hypothetical protein
MNLDGQAYESVVADFKWNIPANYNIGVDTCDKCGPMVTGASRSYVRTAAGRRLSIRLIS